MMRVARVLADKSLRELLDFIVAHLLRLSYPFFLIPWDLDLRFRNSKSENTKSENTSKSDILEIFPLWYILSVIKSQL